jgi:hypothetical protein
MNRTLGIAALSLALAACSPDFDPASQVDGMRVLAVQAEPPEIAPPGDPDGPNTAALTSLILRPDWIEHPGRQTTIVYLVCTPVPGVPAPSPCVLMSELRDPTAELVSAAEVSCALDPALADTKVPPPIAFAGAEVCDWTTGCGPVTLPALGTLPPPALALPPAYGELFAALPAGAPEQLLGVEAAVLAFAIDATPDELAEGGGACPLAAAASRLSTLWATRAHVLAVKRVRIRGPLAPADPVNENPGVPLVHARGVALDPAGATTVAAGAIPLAHGDPPPADLQPYTELDAEGATIGPATEELVYSWFSTAGDLENLHTRGDEVEEWRVGGGRALVAVVVRDLRGGVAWAVHRVEVAP